MKKTANSILFAASTLIIIAIIAVVLVSIGETRRVQDTSAMLARTNDVIFQTERILSLSIDNVTIARGYLLTGDKKFKDGIKTNKEQIHQQIDLLTEKVSDNPQQLGRVDSMREFIEGRVERSDRIVQLREQGSMQEAITEIASGRGVQYLDNIRQMISRIQREERDLLDRRRVANEEAISNLNNILVLILSVVVLLLILLVVRLRSDMSLQKQADAQNRYLAALVAQVPDAIISTNSKRLVASWNKGAELLYGWTEAEAIGKKAADLIRPKFTHDSLETIIKTLEKSTFWQGELVHHNRSGQPLEVWVSSSRLEDSRGENTGSVNVIRDITEKKKIEKKLLEYNQELAAEVQEKTAEIKDIFERVNDGFLAFDSEFRIIYVNQKAAEMLTMRPSELLGRTAWDIFPSAFELGYVEIFTQAMKNQQSLQREEYSSGLKKWFEVNIHPSAKGITIFLRDISEKKKAKQDLQESEAKFKGLVEQSLVGVYIVQDGKFVYVNPQMAEILGCSPEEMMALPTILQLVDESDKARVRENLNLRIGGDVKSLNYEFVARRKDGQLVNLEVFGSLTQYNGRPAIIGTAIDNTVRKMAEREIRRSNERFQLLAKATNDAMWDWDMRSHNVWWNEKHYQLYGRSPSNSPLEWQAWQERIHPEDRPLVVADLDRTLARSKPYWEKQYRFRLANGEYGHVHDRVYIVYEDEKPVRMLGSVMNITERIRSEERLRASEHKYKLLFDNNPLPMWMLTLPERRFIDVNAAALKQYGYNREEFLQLDAYSIRPESEFARFDEYLKIRKPGTSYAGIWKHRKKNGEIIDVDIITHEISYEGRQAMLLLSIDVTEKLLYETQVRETTEQLRELSAHLQNIREEERLNIAREIHDELGQQLTVLKMDMSWLRRKLESAGESITQRVREVLNMLDKTVKTVRRIATELRPSILDDLGLVAAMEWQAEEFSQKSGIHVNMEVQAFEAVVPAALSINLFRIFQESLTNVARHAQATRVTVSLEFREEHLVLAITDNGRGFDDSLIPRKKTLGLLGMKERAAIHGGTYMISSSPGEGTRVEVSVPLPVLERAGT